jgi:hypothetical protein
LRFRKPAGGDGVVVSRENAAAQALWGTDLADDQRDLATACGAQAEAVEFVDPVSGKGARLQGCRAVSGVEAYPPRFEAKGTPVQGCLGDGRAALLLERGCCVLSEFALPRLDVVP